MDKNSNIGIALIILIMVVFWWLQKPSEAEQRRYQQYYDSIARVEQEQKAVQELEATAQLPDTAGCDDSTKVVMMNQKFGLLAEACTSEESQTTIENDLISVTFNSRGGKIQNVSIKNYSSYNDSTLNVYADNANTRFGFYFVHNNRSYNTNDLVFSTEGAKVTSDSTTEITYTLGMGDGALRYVYTIARGTYEVGLRIESENLDGKMVASNSGIELEWDADMPAQEKSHKSEGMWSNICYRFAEGDVEQMDATGVDEDEVNMKLDWVAYKNQYFSSIMQARDGFAGANLKSEAYKPEAENIKKVSSRLGVKMDFRNNGSAEFRFLFLPNYFYTLDSYEDMDLTELLPLGWGIFGWINRWFIIPVFKYLEMVFTSYGIVILLLTILIKLIISPLTLSSFKSQAKMRVLKPQIDAINAKIPEDKPLERNQATMELYRKAGVSPMGGCLPMLLQMPILFAAFRFFPAAIELRGKTFLWADDLSAYDSILDLPFSIPFYGDHVSLFCLLMCVTQVVYTKFTMQSQNTNAMPGMNVMMYMMPVMLLFFFNDYAAGLCYYYFLSSLITILMTVVIKNFFIDDKAILAQLEANKKKPVKKSRFQQMYEQQMKAMQQQQKK